MVLVFKAVRVAGRERLVMKILGGASVGHPVKKAANNVVQVRL
jgi:hypothetical protein